MGRLMSSNRSTMVVFAVALGVSLHMLQMPVPESSSSFVTATGQSTVRLNDESHGGFGLKASAPRVAVTPLDQGFQQETRTNRMSKTVPRSAGFGSKAVVAAGVAVVGTLVTNSPYFFSTTDIRRFLHLPYKIWMRWEERWLGPVNFDRANLRISSMDTYAVCAGVLLQTIMTLYTTINGNRPADDASRFHRIMFDIQVFFVSVACLCSTWTFVMFLFNKIYCMKHIALYHDVNYAVFTNATRKYRIHAFQALIMSLFTYIIAYGAVLFTTLSGPKGIYACLLVLIFGSVMAVEGGNMVRDAQIMSGVDFHWKDIKNWGAMTVPDTV